MSEPTPAAVPLGARSLDGRRCSFGVWAPHATRVDLDILEPRAVTIPMAPAGRGYFAAEVDDAPPGTRYVFRLDGGPARPDPASRFQPDGVHGASAVVPRDFAWTDADWRPPALADTVLYELHAGTFTPEGTFAAIIPRLPALARLGINAIELMPVAQFPGARNWGYDGVCPFAVQDSYGGPAGLKALVDACHAAGIAVVLDVVYNHLGPEGNYLAEFGPYFDERYHTPWGSAFNFSGPHSDEVRRYFIENALQWIDEFHIDGLRLDAVHAILDTSAYPFLRQLADDVRERTRALGRTAVLIAESDLGDPRVVRPAELGGHGLDGQWIDDFHHALHTVLTGESEGYYADYGTLEQLATACRTGYVYTGQFSRFRQRSHGAPPDGIRPAQLVVFDQNHDQVGNRMRGDRLSTLLDFERIKVSAAAVLLSPFTPLLFMGQEYGDPAPFPYFVSHSDADLVEAVRKGRGEEFAAFSWQGRPPDPQAEETFRSAILDWDLRERDHHAVLLELHAELLRLRAGTRVLTGFDRLHADVVDRVIVVRRCGDAGDALFVLCTDAPARLDLPDGRWQVRFDSAAARWNGPGGKRLADAAGPVALPAWSALLLTR